MPNAKKATVLQTNDRKMKGKSIALAKSKELHPHAQSKYNAAHLLLPQTRFENIHNSLIC